MKKLLIAFLAILLTVPVFAEAAHHGGHGWGWGGRWVAPVVVGGVIAYDLAYPYPVYAPPYPDYAQPAPVYAPSVAPLPVHYWYFCSATNAYVPTCQSGWQAVPVR
jgi:hypothetical protein